MKKEKTLKHFGVLGMHWGHHKQEDSGGSGGRSSKKSNVELNREILKKNPNAAVVNYDALKKTDGSKNTVDNSERNKKILIGAALGITVIAGTALYLKNKKTVDAAVANFLKNNGSKKIDVNGISDVEKQVFKNGHIGKVKTKEDVVAANFIASWIGSDRHRYDAISPEEYKSFDDNDLVLKSGQIFKRISNTATEEARDIAFVSFDEDDSNRYAAFLPAMWKVNGQMSRKPESFQHTIESISDIRSPSKKKRVDIFYELLKNDPDFRDEFEDIEFITVRGSSIHDLALRRYNKLATSLIDKNSVNTKKYIDAVKKHGYNAIVDDNDAGRLSRTPLILFNASDHVRKGSKRLTSLDYTNALNAIKNMPGESLENTKAILSIKQDYVDKALSGDIRKGIQAYYNALKED